MPEIRVPRSLFSFSFPPFHLRGGPVERLFALAVVLVGLMIGPAWAQTSVPTATRLAVPALPVSATLAVTSNAVAAPAGIPSPLVLATDTLTVTLTPPSPTAAAPTSSPSPTATVVFTSTATPTLPSPTTSVSTTTPSPTATQATTPAATLTPPSPTATGTIIPSATPILIPTPTPDRRPLIFIRAYRTEPAAIVAGNEFRLFLELHNVGNESATNIVVTFVTETFVPVGSSSAKTVSRLTRDEHGMVWQDLQVSAGTQSGTYPQVVKIDYADPRGNRYSTSETVGVTVIKPVAGRPQIVVERTETNPPAFFPGSEFDLTLTLHNLGDRQARNVLITLAGDGPFAPLGEGNIRSIVSLGAGQALTTTMRLVVDRETRPGAYNQKVTLEYDDLTGNHYTANQSIGLVVAAERSERPMLMVRNYNLSTALQPRSRDVAELAPGGIFTLTLEVENVGQRRAYRALLSLGGGQPPGGQTTGGATGLGIFAPLESSNVKFIPLLEPGERYSVTQRMAVDGSAASGVYVLTVTFAYDDQTGASYTGSELISLLVIRRALLRIDLFQPVGEVEVGKEFSIPVEVINVGRHTVNVTTVEVTSADLEVRDGVLYIGPLDSGTSGTLEAHAVANRAGPVGATVTVHYIDDFGREQQVIQDLTFQAKRPPVVELPGLTKEQPGQDGGLLGRVWRFIRALLGLGG